MLQLVLEKLRTDEGRSLALRIAFLVPGFMLLMVGNSIATELRRIGVDAVAVSGTVNQVQEDRRGSWLVVDFDLGGATHDLILEQSKNKRLANVRPGDSVPLLVDRDLPTRVIVDSPEREHRAQLLVILGILLIMAGMLPRPQLMSLINPD